MQSRTASLIESVTNIIIGYLIAVLSQIVIFPHFDIYLSMGEQLHIAAWFTLVSIVRTYMLRRTFNKLTTKAYRQTAQNTEQKTLRYSDTKLQ